MALNNPNFFATLTENSVETTIPNGGAWMVVDADGSQTLNVAAGGSLEVTGQSGQNTINVEANAADFEVELSDNLNVVLTGPNGESITIQPDGNNTQSVVFGDGASEISVDDQGNALLGNQVVDTQATVNTDEAITDANTTSGGSFGDGGDTGDVDGETFTLTENSSELLSDVAGKQVEGEGYNLTIAGESGAAGEEIVAGEITNPVSLDIDNVGTLTFDFNSEDGDSDAPTLELSAESSLTNITSLVISDGTVVADNADLQNIGDVTVNSGLSLSSSQLAGITGTIGGSGNINVNVNDQDDADALSDALGRLGSDVQARVSNNSDDENVQDTIDNAVSGSGNENVTVVSELTLAEAVTGLQGDGNPEHFSIDTEEVFDAGAVTVDAAASTFADVQTVIDVAENTGELALADLFNWTVEDTLANIEAADAAVIDGADSYSLTNADTDLAVLSPEQVALLEGAENSGDFTFSVPGDDLALTADADLVSPDGADFESEDGSLTAADFDNVLQSTADGDTIEATTASLSSDKTLNSGDLIDGGEGSDTLAVAMNNSFSGFSGDGGMQNVETVELTNSSSISRTFNASNIEGVGTYVLDAASADISLDDLEAAGIRVVTNQESGDLSVGFTSDAVSGSEDALTVGLDNVGTRTEDGDVDEALGVVDTNGIEELILETTEANDSIVDLSDSGDATALTAQGDGDLTITDVGENVETVESQALNGTLTADLSSVTGGDLSTVTGGDGGTNITASLGGLATEAELTGGAGENSLTIDGGDGTIRPAMSGFSELNVADIDGMLTLSGENVAGLQSVTLGADTDGENVTLANLPNGQLTITANGEQTTQSATTYTSAGTLFFETGASETTVENEGTDEVARDVTAQNVTTVQVDVGAYSNYSGTVTAPDSETAQLNVASAVDDNDAETTKFSGTLRSPDAPSVVVDAEGQLDGTIEAGNAESVDVTTGSSGDDTLTLNTGSAVQADFSAGANLDIGDSDLSSVEQLTLNTDGKFDATTVSLDSIVTATINGSAGTSQVVLGTLGTDELTNSIELNAQGLAASDDDLANTGDGLETGDITTDGENITLSLANMWSGAVLGDISTGGDSGSVNLNVDGTGGDVEVDSITGQTVTVEANGLNGTLRNGSGNAVEIIAGVATIQGVGTEKNEFDVDAEEISYTGGLGDDTVTITGTAEESGGASNIAALDIDLDLGTNEVIIDGDGVTANAGSTIQGGIDDDTITVDASGDSDLTAAAISDIDEIVVDSDLTLTAAQVEGFGDDVEFSPNGAANLTLEVNGDADISDNTTVKNVLNEVDFGGGDHTLTMTVAQHEAVDNFTSTDDGVQTITLSDDDNGDQIVIGSDGADTITGGEGADTLTGGDGADRIEGGAGADELTGGAGNDTFVFNDGDGVAADSSATGTSGEVSNNGTLTFTNVETITDYGDGIDTIEFGGEEIISSNESIPSDVGTFSVQTDGNVKLLANGGQSVAGDGTEFFFAPGSYDANNGVFTIGSEAGGAGNGPNAAFFQYDEDTIPADGEVDVTGIQDIAVITNDFLA